MDALKYQALVASLESDSTRDPQAYRRRVATLGVLGYAYVFGMLLLLVAASVGVTVAMVYSKNVVLLKLLIALLVVMGAVLSALWVKMAPPEGVQVTRQEAPRLFDLVDEVSHALRAPAVHEVVMDATLNAGIIQLPRLGALGSYKNYLVIGWPLLAACAPEEWHAILAHEMGHLSRNHGRFGAWVYRIRMTWSRLFEAVRKKRSRLGQLLFGRFLAWYAPYFNAYSFVLARQHEYDADRAAADVVGEEVARHALLRIELASRTLAERFWPGLVSEASESAEPPAGAFSRMAEALGSAPAEEDAARWIATSWRRAGGVDDPHPTLSDRLHALGWRGGEDGSGEPPPPPPLDGPTAAEHFLGSSERPLRTAVEQEWSRAAAPSWRERHEEVAHALDRAATLDAKEPEGLTVDEEWERVDLLADLGQTQRAASLARRLLERTPEHVGARFFLGRVLLDEGDPSGVEYVERAMRDEPNATLAGCQILFAYFQDRGDASTATRYRQRAEEYGGAMQKAHDERMTLPRSARFAPHTLSDAELEDLRTQLRSFKGIKRAYLVRRTVRWLPDRPCHVLCLQPGGFLTTAKGHRRLVHEVASSVHGPDGLVVFIERTGGRVRRRIRKQPRSRIV